MVSQMSLGKLNVLSRVLLYRKKKVLFLGEKRICGTEEAIKY